jgi:hypothetical protein
MFHLLSIVSVLCLVLSSALIIYKAPGDGSLSISERAVSKRWTYLLFAVSISLFGSIFWFYLYREIGSRIELTFLFRLAVVAGWLGMLFMAWMPARTGAENLRGPHSWGVLVMCLSIVVCVALVPFNARINLLIRLIAVGLTAWYCYTIYLWTFKLQASRKHLLTYELMNIGSFLVFMVFI